MFDCKRRWSLTSNRVGGEIGRIDVVTDNLSLVSELG